MSFANSKERDDRSTSGSAVSELSVLVSTIHTNNQVLKRLVNLPSDKPRQRSLDELVSRNKAAQAEGERLAHSLEREKPQSVRDEVAANKLVRDFRSVVREFQDVRKILESQEKVNEVSPYGPRKITTKVLKPEPGEKTYLLGGGDQLSQSQLLLLDEEEQQQQVEARALASNQQYMESRQTALSRVHNQFQEVNEIFKDLGVVIIDQGAQLDEVEADTAQARSDLRLGNVEIKKGQARLRARRKFFFLALIIVAVTIVVLLLVLLH
ncbi:hypothetical protein NDN08_002688 [Rhodosorus marinus]|uniref:t-SNARE coiled-coil homology domain-containing protein n=1 Tax=Rhodosorus marinus TaxID=101924 RepID=A0AAV8UX45_9RHOD|nr:hypothetical protein NDN08_002688 [Rhodosorus marinus]